MSSVGHNAKANGKADGNYNDTVRLSSESVRLVERCEPFSIAFDAIYNP